MTRILKSEIDDSLFLYPPLMFTRKLLITLVAKKNDVGDKCGGQGDLSALLMTAGDIHNNCFLLGHCLLSESPFFIIAFVLEF